MFQSNLIKKRVMEVINAKIDKAELDYEEGVKLLEEQFEMSKNDLANTLVEGITKKFI